MGELVCAQPAGENTSEAKMGLAQDAQRQNVEPIRINGQSIEKLLSDIARPTQKSVLFGSTDGVGAPGATSPPNSTNSATPSNASKRRYRKPRTALQLAAQASAVATALLNGTLDLDTARAYGTIARTAAQSLGVEVQTGRFLKTSPSLDMSWEAEEPE